MLLALLTYWMLARRFETSPMTSFTRRRCSESLVQVLHSFSPSAAIKVPDGGLAATTTGGALDSQSLSASTSTISTILSGIPKKGTCPDGTLITSSYLTGLYEVRLILRRQGDILLTEHVCLWDPDLLVHKLRAAVEALLAVSLDHGRPYVFNLAGRKVTVQSWLC